MREKETLFTLDNWSVCRFNYDEEEPDIYAEHHNGCDVDVTEDKTYWCWEFDDVSICGRKDTPECEIITERCWCCESKVPEEIVGLVMLHNYNRPRRD